MLDFTSALYLGLWHDSWSLRPWAQLTTGVPPVLACPPGARAMAARLARLQGCESALPGPSTLHLFWDLFAMLGRRGSAVYLDGGAYPIAGWGAAHAALRGVPVRRFPHRDVSTLKGMIAEQPGRRPIVVSDGVCGCCGTPAPVPALLEAVRRAGGLLVLDDTQAVGLLGHSPAPEAPYGRGGGGVLRRCKAGGPDVVLVSSLAKAFGAPVAVLSGSRQMVERFEAASLTRTYCSAPSVAAIHAAARALEVNERLGDALRRQLAQRVRFFREGLQAAGLLASGGLFPIQRLLPLPAAAARELHAGLLALGVRTVLQACGDGSTGRIAFVLTARHRTDAIERAVEALARQAAGLPWVQPRRG